MFYIYHFIRVKSILLTFYKSQHLNLVHKYQFWGSKLCLFTTFVNFLWTYECKYLTSAIFLYMYYLVYVLDDHFHILVIYCMDLWEINDDDEGASSPVSDMDHYVIIHSRYYILFSIHIWYSCAGRKFKHTFMGFFVHNVAKTRYDIGWFTEQLDLVHQEMHMIWYIYFHTISL
jgi:hypothetical protein